MRASATGSRVAEREPQREAVELRLRQREGAVLLDRVLRRDHEERGGQRPRDAVDRDLALLHALEQRRLRARRGAVELVGEHDVREHRARAGTRTRSLRWSNTLTPVTSLGSTSGVSWTRANEQSSERASARASVVLPTPGTSSTSTCPSASSATTARSTTAPLAAHGEPDVRDHAQGSVAGALQSLRLGKCGLHRTHRTPGRAEFRPASSCSTRSRIARRDLALGRTRHRARRRRRRRARPRCARTSKPMSLRETSLRTIRSTPLRTRLASARCDIGRRPRPRTRRAPGRDGGARRGRRARRPWARARATTSRRARACPPAAPPAGSRRRRPPSASRRPTPRGRAPRARAARVVSTSTTDPDSGRTLPFASSVTTSAPRALASAASAAPMRPDERLPRKRTPSSGSRVPPAVTSTRRPASGPDARAISASIAATISARLGHAAHALLALGELALGRGRRTYDAALAQPLDIGLGRGVLPHAHVHGRSHEQRRGRRERALGDDVVGHPPRQLRERVRGARRDADDGGVARRVEVRDTSRRAPAGRRARAAA